MKELWRWLREVGNGTIPFCMQRQLSKNLPRLKAWQSWAKLLSSLIDGKKNISKWTIFSFQQWQRRCLFRERLWGWAAPFLSLFWEIQTGCWGFVLSMVWDIPVVTQGHLSWLCPLPVSGWGARKGSVQALLSWNWNIPVLSALLSAQIQNTALCWILGGKLTLLQPKL